jgi:hypothetical protein
MLWVAIASIGGFCLILAVAAVLPDEPESSPALSNPVYQKGPATHRQLEAFAEHRYLLTATADGKELSNKVSNSLNIPQTRSIIDGDPCCDRS